MLRRAKIFVQFSLLFSTLTTFGVSINCKTEEEQVQIKLESLDSVTMKKVVISSLESGKSKQYTLPNSETTTYTTPVGFFDASRNATIKVQILDESDFIRFEDKCRYKAPRRAEAPKRAKAAEKTKTEHRERTISQEKLEGYADQQARTVANRVVEAYGAREAYKQSFIKGLQRSYQHSKIFDMVNSEYSRGYSDGQFRALKEGSSIAQSAAKADAVLAATADARHNQKLRIDGASDRHTTGPVSNLKLASFIIPEKNYRDSLRGRVRNNFESEFVVEVKRSVWGNETYSISYDPTFNLDLWAALEAKNERNLTQSFLRDEHAFSEWEKNGLGGRYDYNLYKKMDHYEKQQFKNAFCRIYNQVIEEKLAKRAEQQDSTAYRSGKHWGKKIADTEAYLKGEQDGFNGAISNAARTVYSDVYAKSYSEIYNIESHRLQTSAVLDTNALATIRSDEFGAIVIDVELLVTNIGGAPFLGSHIGISAPNFKTRTFHEDTFFNPHERRTIHLPTVLQLNSAVVADSPIEIKIVFADFRSTLITKVRFDDLVSAYAASNGLNRIAKDSIILSLEKEWYDNSGTFQTDIYSEAKQGRSQCYLAYLVRNSFHMPVLSSLKPAIKEMNRPGAFWHFNKESSFTSLLEEMAN